jgi:hypothetical protein
LAIKAKLEELGCYDDDDETVIDYIMVMVANKKTQDQMTEDLKLFLSKHSSAFTKWFELNGGIQLMNRLHEMLERLHALGRASVVPPKPGEKENKQETSNSRHKPVSFAVKSEAATQRKTKENRANASDDSSSTSRSPTNRKNQKHSDERSSRRYVENERQDCSSPTSDHDKHHHRKSRKKNKRSSRRGSRSPKDAKKRENWMGQAEEQTKSVEVTVQAKPERRVAEENTIRTRRRSPSPIDPTRSARNIVLVRPYRRADGPPDQPQVGII